MNLVQQHASPEDLALYAMQFLAPEESAAIAKHLELCTECRRELADIQGELAAYALTVELQEPSPQARQRLMKQVGREKKIIPFAPPAQPELMTYGRSSLGRSSLLDADEEPRPRRSFGLAIFGGLGWAVAAGLAFAVYTTSRESEALRASLGSDYAQIARLTADAASAHQLMDTLTDPKAIRVTLNTTVPPKIKVPPTPTGRATYNPDKGSLIFIASNLDPLQMYKVYELWLIPTEGKPIPAGTFHPDAHGFASIVMPDLPKGVQPKAFGVTVEDDGGSPVPTSAIIMAGS